MHSKCSRQTRSLVRSLRFDVVHSPTCRPRFDVTDQRADRDRRILALMPLVKALAGRYARRGEPLDDLIQVGTIGLIKAVDR